MIKVSTKVSKDVKGLNNLKKKMRVLEQKEVHWGFLSGSHSQADMSYAALAFLLEVGRRNEAGSGWDIPPRPAFRQSVSILRQSESFKKMLSGGLSTYLTEEGTGALSGFLDRTGRYLQNSYEESMINWKVNGTMYQHNRPMTIRLKGFDQPYVETGELTQNVQYQIE